MIYDWIAYAVVVWALITIVLRIYKQVTKKSTCDGCACSVSNPVPEVIPMELRFTRRPTNDGTKTNIK